MLHGLYGGGYIGLSSSESSATASMLCWDTGEGGSVSNSSSLCNWGSSLSDESDLIWVLSVFGYFDFGFPKKDETKNTKKSKEHTILHISKSKRINFVKYNGSTCITHQSRTNYAFGLWHE